jgi:hypothetical protein
MPDLPRLGRRALQAGSLPENPTPIFLTPSRLHGLEEGKVPRLRSTTYGPRLDLTLPPGAGRGLLIHRALELLGQGVYPDKARGLLGVGIPDADWRMIREMAASFVRSLHENLEPTALNWEVPITSTNRIGSVIGGTIDLLVETQDGFWIVDHKTDEPENLEEGYRQYLPQLMCYSQALKEGMGLELINVAIHWACLGVISYAGR